MDASRYADLFLTESQEHLSAINHALLELERAPGALEPVDALFRAVHTVKGMSATMGYAGVTALSHELESLMDLVRRGKVLVTPEVMDTLFLAADALERTVDLEVKGRAEEVEVSGLVTALRGLASGDGARAAGAAPVVEGDEAAARPAGAGIHAIVRLEADTPLRGVRAFLVLQKARTLGTVVGTTPPESALQSEEFDLEFTIHLDSALDDAAIEGGLRGAGHVERVTVRRTSAESAAAPTPSQATGAASAAGGDAAAPTHSRSVRIDLRRLDALMNLIGELVIARGRLTQLSASIADPSLVEAVSHASRLVSQLQDEIMTSRMVPVGQIFDRFPRLVRDAARTLGKQVDFVMEGKDIELDRSMLDEIGEPVVHLLRNAVDHGLESPAERTAQGKPAAGQLRLSAVRDRSAVLIRVSDDGKGIDRGRVLARAKERGLVEASKTELSDEELIRIIGRPGFSTAEKVTDISGRGVGIDAVNTRVRQLGGSLDIRTAPGKGTTVTARLPLTLAIVRALLAKVNDETYALPMTHVNETVELTPQRHTTVKGREVLVLRDDVLPLIHLRDVVHLPRRDEGLSQVIVLEQSDRRAGIVVDRLVGQQEIVVKQFDAVRGGVSHFSGATILGDGAPALILDVSSLL